MRRTGSMQAVAGTRPTAGRSSPASWEAIVTPITEKVLPPGHRRRRIERSGKAGDDAAQIAVVLAEGDAERRLNVRHMLAADAAISVVADTGAASTAAQLALRHSVGVVVFGSTLEGDEVLDAIETVRQRAPDIRSVVLMEGHDEHEQHAVLMAGAAGVLPSGMAVNLPDAVRALHVGEAVVPPRLLTSLLRRFRGASASQRAGQPVLEPLSSREWQIIEELAAGRTTAAAAERLGIAPATVHSHLRNIYGKLGVRSRAEALAAAARLRSGWCRRPFGASAASFGK